MDTNVNKGKYHCRPLTMTVDTGATGVMDAVSDACIVDVRDLSFITVILNQILDGGTCTLTVEYTCDGINWLTLGTKAEGTFPVGNNKALAAYTLSDANGMPLVAEQVRVTLTAFTAGGSYTAAVSGLQRAGWTG